MHVSILYVGAAVMFRLAVRLIQCGSVSYTSKVDIRTALSRAAKTAPA